MTLSKPLDVPSAPERDGGFVDVFRFFVIFKKKDVVTRKCLEMMKRAQRFAVFWGEGDIMGICIINLMDFIM